MRNLLALFGFACLVAFIMLFVQFKPYFNLYNQIDSESKGFIIDNLNKVSTMEPNVLKNYINQVKALDPKAYDLYLELADVLLKSGDIAEATIWKFPVEDDLSIEDVVETMKFVANERNFANVGQLPLYKDITSKLGKEHRYVEMFLFCDSLIAAKMLEYSDSFSAYFPCRITLVEDTSGKLWLYTLNMDMMIYGGKTLPPELLKQALIVKESILDIMKRGASGEF
ncbi:MAG: DUF302 domain-containing protein [Pseudomonadota bacterium]